MGDGVKEDPAVQSTDPVFLAKAGWVKKASGRFLAGYKDRYVHLGKTEISVYDNEDRQTCLERVDLENYDKCLELKSAFKKKNRLVLVRTPKSGNKIQDVKFQAQSPEEKGAWIKALSEGINRAKNKIFDEVKVDEGSNLEHVTRNRPKGNRNRRPPTRIHMKEVANVSSDGILRLDLDLEDATMPNGTHYITTDTTDSPKEAVKSPTPPSKASETIEEELAARSADEEPQTEEEPQKKALKPPMPPSKEAKPTEAAMDEPTMEDSSEKKVLKPPMPPSKEAKPTASAKEEPPKEANGSEKVLKPPMPPSKEAKPSAPPSEKPTQESSPEEEQDKSAGAETGPPPTPPNKPTSGSTDNLTEASQSRQEKPIPPTPPSKDKKYSLDQHQELLPSESDDTTDENKEQKKDEGEEENEKEEVADVKQNGVPETVNEIESSESLPEVKEQPVVTDPSESTTEDRGGTKLSEPSPEEPGSSGGTDTASNQQPQKSFQLPTPSVPTPEPIKKNPGPPALPKKKPVKVPLPKAAVSVDEPKTQTTEETIVTQPQEKPEAVVPPQMDVPAASADTEEDVKLSAVSKRDFAAVVLSLSDPMADSTSPLPCHSEKKEREEEKSIDSGQHSDDDSEGSESEDLLAASTATLRGSRTHLDVMDVSDDDAETPDSLGRSTDEEPPALTQTQVDSKLKSTFIQVQLSKGPRPPVPLKPSFKARSASVGDLLSEASNEKRQPTREVPLADVDTAPKGGVGDLESEVAQELEKTGELLSSEAQSKGHGLGEGKSGELLVKAMETLKRADQFLREAKNLKESKLLNTIKRTSW